METVRRLIRASMSFSIARGVRSVPFVTMSLNGTPYSRTASQRSGKSRVMNGSVSSDSER